MCECLEKNNWMQICLDVLPIYTGGKTRHSCSRPLRTTGAWSSTLRLYRTSRAERDAGVKRWEVVKKKQIQRYSKPEREILRKKMDKKGLNKGRRWFACVCVCLCTGSRKWGGWRYTAASVQTFRHKWEKSSWLCLQDDDLYQWSDSVVLWMTACVCGCVRVWRGDSWTTASQSHWYFMLIQHTHWGESGLNAYQSRSVYLPQEFMSDSNVTGLISVCLYLKAFF